MLILRTICTNVYNAYNVRDRYGKTAVGLSKDWGVTVEEAAKTVELWCLAI